jgi:ankyrin repeat protein
LAKPTNGTMGEDRCEIHRRFQAADAAYRAGDVESLRRALGEPPDFPNCRQPLALALGEFPLEYAIYWSPLAFVAALIELGADVNYSGQGFPSLIAALSTDRPDRGGILRLLLEKGADVGQRGINDWTPLHYAVARRDLQAVATLLAHGADPTLRARIDDCTTPLDDAQAIDLTEAVELMRKAMAQGRRVSP